MKVLLGLLFLILVTCEAQLSSRAQQTETLRHSIFAGYDKSVIPLPVSGPLNVSVHINFISPRRVAFESGVLEMRLWLDLVWVDSRLQWNSVDYPDVESFPAAITLADRSLEVWTPDVNLLNQDQNPEKTLANTRATVFSNGTVWWSRPGFLAADCKFSGLTTFPWDLPKCTFEIGSWTYDQTEVYLITLDDGWSFGGLASTDTIELGRLESTRELVLNRVEVTNREYSLGSHRAWRVLQYTITVRRRSKLMYVLQTIIPSILLLVTTFLAFFMNPEGYERLMFVSMMVVIQVLLQFIHIFNIPLWESWNSYLRVTTAVSYLTIFVLMESALVYVFYWSSRIVRAKPAMRRGPIHKLRSLFRVPVVPMLLHEASPTVQRQESSLKIRQFAQASDHGSMHSDYSQQLEPDKKAVRSYVRERKVQRRIEEERHRTSEVRLRFIASRIDLIFSIIFPFIFVVVLFALVGEIVDTVRNTPSGNLDDSSVLGPLYIA